MLLVLHIIAALGGIGASTYALYQPSVLRIRVSAILVSLTVISGSIIVIKEHLSIMSVCLSGLLYVGYTASALLLSAHRLAKQAKRAD